MPLLGKKITSICLFVACVCALVLFWTALPPYATIHSFSPHSTAESGTIPNIVHYTQLKRNSHSSLEFNFESFLSLYSAVLLFSPTAVYIHTDHNVSTVAKARISGSKWTQKVLNSFPEIVKVDEVCPPDVLNGVEIHVEAKSDFVRWEVLYQYGGIYMNWDVLPLRDIAQLRKSNFSSVVGRQIDGKINPGCVMTRPKSALSEIMRIEGPRLFDGLWETHSVYLVTTVSERLAGAPAEILILDHKAIAPTAWYPDSVDSLFSPHDDADDAAEIQILDQIKDPMRRWEQRVRNRGSKMDLADLPAACL